MSQFNLYAVLLGLFLSYSAFGQNGNFYGKVKYDSNEPAVATFIALKGNSITKETNSNINGSFTFKDIPYGEYTISFYSLNDQPKTVTITLDSKNKEVNVTLEVAALDEVLVRSKTIQQKIEEKGFAVFRLLGDKMRPDKMMKLMNSIDNGDINIDQLSGIGDILSMGTDSSATKK